MHDRLHWLNMRARIDFKLSLTAYRCLHGLAPSYLSGLCIPVTQLPGRSHLRSASSGELLVPSCRTKTFGPRAFAVSCPTTWNNLPVELTDPANVDSVAVFKKRLKTHFFSSDDERRLIFSFDIWFCFCSFVLPVDAVLSRALRIFFFREHVNI